MQCSLAYLVCVVKALKRNKNSELIANLFPMNKLLCILHWLASSLYALALAYIANPGGISTKLQEAAQELTPLLAAILPFFFIGFGISSALWSFSSVAVMVMRVRHYRRMAPRNTFEEAAEDIDECVDHLRRLIDDQSTGIILAIPVGTARERRVRIETYVAQLTQRLRFIDIDIPWPIPLDDTSSAIALLEYLAKLSSYARKGNLLEAQRLRGDVVPTA